MVLTDVSFVRTTRSYVPHRVPRDLPHHWNVDFALLGDVYGDV